MAKSLEKILIIDVEATCWDGPNPPGQENEIIEIGLCVLNTQTLEREEKRGIFVKPERSEISPFCTQLTTLTPEIIAQEGMSFKEACKTLRVEYHAQQLLWASYGDYDRRQFERQCAANKIGYPFGVAHLNVKTLTALYLGLTHEVGMATALEKLDMPLDGTHHRGIDDAWNIAGILAKIMKKWKV